MASKTHFLFRYTLVISAIVGGWSPNSGFAQSLPSEEKNSYSIPAEVATRCVYPRLYWNSELNSMIEFGCREYRTTYTCPEGTRNAQNGRCLLPYRPSSFDPNEVLTKPAQNAGVIHERIAPKQELLNNEVLPRQSEALSGV